MCEKHGADPSVLDNNKMKAVDRARLRGYKEVVRYLLNLEKKLINAASNSGSQSNDSKG